MSAESPETNGYPHRPYASVNWIRFIGSLRCRIGLQYLSPLSGHPW